MYIYDKFKYKTKTNYSVSFFSTSYPLKIEKKKLQTHIYIKSFIN